MKSPNNQKACHPPAPPSSRVVPPEQKALMKLWKKFFDESKDAEILSNSLKIKKEMRAAERAKVRSVVAGAHAEEVEKTLDSLRRPAGGTATEL